MGHIFSVFLERSLDSIDFPLAMLTVSGGHNDLYLVAKGNNDQRKKMSKSCHHLGDFSIYKMGSSIDDAAGEAFDKVARMLGGPYPGGPWIDKMADQV